MNSKIIITQDMITKCSAFAAASVSSSSDQYARRNQFNVNKIEKDIKIGKIGEECVYLSLSESNYNLTKPDHEIYSKENKSWDTDLKDLNSDVRISVKTQDIEQSYAYGESWVFQGNFNSKVKTDYDKEVFLNKNPNHYAAFVLLNVPKRIATIKAIVKIDWLLDNSLFKPMQKQSLQGNKSAVYFDDLEKYSDELFQL
jgi:hypothetical protein